MSERLPICPAVVVLALLILSERVSTVQKIAQDPEIGISQKKDQFWLRVSETYNSGKPNESMPDRSLRSLESRMHSILSAISKFKSCIQQIEYMKPSGISQNDLMNRAKDLMKLEPKYAKGFKFEHVWDIMKDFEKFSCKSQKTRADSSNSYNSTTPIEESPVSPTSIPFSVNLSDDSGNSSGSQRPLGVKKSKLKKKKCEDMSVLVNTILENQKRMKEYYEESKKVEEQKIAALDRANELAKRRADEQTMLIDPQTITDPARRLFIEQKQAEIVQRMRDESLTSINNNFPFQNYFSDIGGSGSGADLGDY